MWQIGLLILTITGLLVVLILYLRSILKEVKGVLRSVDYIYDQVVELEETNE